MNKILKYALPAVAALFVAACAPSENKPVANVANAGNSNVNATRPASAPPTREALMAVEKGAWEAWKNRDAKFFEENMSAKFIGFGPNGRTDKAGSIRSLTEQKCEIRSYTLADEQMKPVGADAALLTYTAKQDYTCDGKVGPPSVRALAVYIREGDKWKNTYYNEVPVIDPKTAKPEAPKAAAPKPAANAAANSNVNTSGSPAAAPATGGMTDAYMALAKKGWEAWKARDAKTLDEITSKDVAYVDLFGKFTATKSEVLKVWTEPKCEIQSVSVSDGKSVDLAQDAAILTFKGEATGTCEGQKLTPVWETAVLIKEGDAWKALFILQTPA